LFFFNPDTIPPAAGAGGWGFIRVSKTLKTLVLDGKTECDWVCGRSVTWAVTRGETGAQPRLPGRPSHAAHCPLHAWAPTLQLPARACCCCCCAGAGGSLSSPTSEHPGTPTSTGPKSPAGPQRTSFFSAVSRLFFRRTAGPRVGGGLGWGGGGPQGGGGWAALMPWDRREGRRAGLTHPEALNAAHLDEPCEEMVITQTWILSPRGRILGWTHGGRGPLQLASCLLCRAQRPTRGRLRRGFCKRTAPAPPPTA
jgi:hypothetical protein